VPAAARVFNPAVRLPDLRPEALRAAGVLGLRAAAATLLIPVLLAPAALAAPQEQGAAPSLDYARDVRPVLEEFCFRCHGPDKQKGEIQLDTMNPDMLGGGDADLWDLVLDILQGGEMPPKDEPQLGDEQRRAVQDWIAGALEEAAAARRGEVRTVLRRLNKRQYTNTLQDLLGLGVDFGRVLPDDGKSAKGFSNDGEVLQASPLHLETYQAIARSALDYAIVTGERPAATRYRVTFGKGIGRGKAAGVTGGYQAVALSADDFTVEILDANGDVVEPRDDAERKAQEAIQRKISIGLRGSGQDRFQVVEDGMVLFSALPHVERTPKSWQGPSPNLKVEMQRVFPERGRFAMRVVASQGYVPVLHEELLLDPDVREPRVTIGSDGVVAVPEGAVAMAASAGKKPQNLRESDGFLVPVDVPKDARVEFVLDFPEDGYYQVDLVHPPTPKEVMPSVRLSLGRRNLDYRPELDAAQLAQPRAVTAVGVLGVRKGRKTLVLGGKFFVGVEQLIVTRLPQDHPQVARLSQDAEELNASLNERKPVIRTLVGTRTDDGMDYATFGEPQVVTSPRGEWGTYEFGGWLDNLPVPEPESGDTEILSGFLLIGLWNDNLAKHPSDTGPPLLVRSIELEAPYYPVWPPESHQQIFVASDAEGDESAYARVVLERFASRAFRRPVTGSELDRYHGFWTQLRGDYATFEDSIREVLVAVLCSPRFLFLAEPVDGDEGVGLGEHALATRLSYFLWDSPPDERLMRLADAGQLRENIGVEVDRMLVDPRRRRFARAFSKEWLRLDRLDQVTIHVGHFPAFTRFVKQDMAEETYAFVEHVLAEDLPVTAFVDSDFALLNQNLAEFYGVDGVVGPAFRPVPVAPAQRRGGLLSQGAFLAGHSDGTWPHPIKRAVWVKEKILGEKPPPPPPNVPDLDPDKPGFEKLTLKEQLELHRNKSSCVDCHLRIDPYGLAFEGYSAVGLLETERRGRPVDALTRLPDGVEVDGVDGLKAYVLGPRVDDFAGALTEYLFSWALGRDTSFADAAELNAIREEAKSQGYRMRALIRAIVTGPSFLER
jgi:mono/diheme cytochrome c family protein